LSKGKDVMHFTDISEELPTSFFRVEMVNLKEEALSSFELEKYDLGYHFETQKCNSPLNIFICCLLNSASDYIH
jgi:hypothetical protein